MTPSDGLKLLLSRINDAVYLAENKYTVKAVGFLTPSEAAYVKRNMPKPAVCKAVYFGGYDEAERTLFIALPEYFDEEAVQEEIAVIKVTGCNISEISHRDVLGSLMGLGIKREMVGDILVFEDKCLIFVRSEIADYILSNLEKIGRNGINASLCNIAEVDIPQKKTEEISGTVAGIRLDSVLSVALKTSRSKAAVLIESGAVSLNWEETDNASKGLNEGDILSVKGKGRFKLSRIGDLTKKGRYAVIVEKYI